MAFVPAFLIDAHEVTVGQYRRFLEASGNRTSTRYQNLHGYAESDRPVVGITLQQAKAYAAWANKSIPTQAEWRAAAAVRWSRSVDGRSMKAAVFEMPWHFLDPRPEVKLAWTVYPPRLVADEPDISCWGAERMASGVREWCLPLDGNRRFGIVRGGTVVRASSRDRLGEELPPALRRMRADTPRNNLGFRCVVRDLGE
jgi:formylglycine-generating enzyme required for sulfatase activity